MFHELTANECKALKYNSDCQKDNYLRDGKGLYLEALPKRFSKKGKIIARKVWRYEFWIDGKKSRITFRLDFGTKKDDGTLKKARKWAKKQRKLVKKGINPTLHAKQKQARKLEEARELAKNQSTFNTVADEWLALHKDDWSPRHYKKAEGIVRRVIREHRFELPDESKVELGTQPINTITSDEILDAVEKPQEEGKHETAHKALEFASQIFKRAVARKLISYNPTYDLLGKGNQGGLKRKKQSTKLPHLTDPEEIGELLKKIDGYNPRHFSVSYCLKILPYVFTRPGELRQATWKEFDFDNARWDIPEERMKARRPHVVPLASQVVTLLEELAAYSHNSADSLLFPSPTKPRQPIADATLSKALKSLGYTGRHVPHGFRHMASTLLNDQRIDNQQLFIPNAIEFQLSHVDKDRIRATYNNGDYLKDRIPMMQWYADYLDGLKSGKPVNIVEFKSNQNEQTTTHNTR